MRTKQIVGYIFLGLFSLLILLAYGLILSRLILN
jgi:hypothetical protein